ncbi:MAG TPA: hypothetical protein VIH21_11010 [Dehalococcoidia bacterium]
MPTNDASTGIARDLNAAIDDLDSALERASAAATTIRTLVPRIGAIGSVLDELEQLIQSGRQHIGVEASAATPAVFPRPTLVVPSAPQVAAPAIEPAWNPEPWSADSTVAEPEPQPEAVTSSEETDVAEAPSEAPRTGDQLVCFRLEFESRPGPLDLRTVDDAVSEHPAVRDVALLDYDGRKATLKVWIVPDASPADVQQSLTERASTLFDSSNDVTIVALEDVA